MDMTSLETIREHTREPRVFPAGAPMNTSGETTDDDDADEDVPLDLVSERARQFLGRFLKGFSSGLGVYSGIKIVTALMRNPFRQSLPIIRAELLAKDSFRFAAFLGLYPSLYDLALELLEQYRRKRDDWNSALAGGLAGLAIVVEDRTRRRIYCLFAIARAIGAVVSTLVRRGLLPAMPYSETMLFCSCTSFLVYCTALKPQYLLTGYYKSVLKWSRDYTDRKLTTLFRQPGPDFLTCSDVGLHEGSCMRHAVTDFTRSLPAFAKLYLPIHLAPIIFFKYKLFLKRPMRLLKAFLKNIVFSTAFLATMVMLAKYGICLLRNFRHAPPPLPGWIPALAGIVAGLGVLFERTNRRRELSLFLIPHTLYAVYLWAKERGVISHWRNSSILIFALAMVPIMHAYEREPESLNLLLHSALKYFVGKRISTVERQKRRTVSEMST
ncbi:uncharacterized protein LOC127850296 [Dreissena polymorpha]|uniref:Transmembrane protein 135 N-terminal domain-containing protein n=1 Tax=Dreissena polymorpha TaxID=45954 RepID=A0A9D4CZP9_DREPO|nr:uncharacterized protein LOC127850296 [Dreissena polymorpha]KAH3735320.1 hypothetical protein DPMN_041785 [Dreissena polymorpha]